MTEQKYKCHACHIIIRETDLIDGNCPKCESNLGLNYQHCHNMVFTGLSDSFEAYYQAVRRCWRFGQDKQVNVWIVTSVHEGAVVANIKRNEEQFTEMLSGMIAATQELCADNIRGTTNNQDYNPAVSMKLPAFIGGVEA